MYYSHSSILDSYTSYFLKKNTNYNSNHFSIDPFEKAPNILSILSIGFYMVVSICVVLLIPTSLDFFDSICSIDYLMNIMLGSYHDSIRFFLLQRIKDIYLLAT